MSRYTQYGGTAAYVLGHLSLSMYMSSVVRTYRVTLSCTRIKVIKSLFLAPTTLDWFYTRGKFEL